jgi:hypothetical protein
VTVLSNEGFEGCKREQTTSRLNRRPADGVWQGVDTRTGSVASGAWVNRPASWPHDIVFIEIGGDLLGRRGWVWRCKDWTHHSEKGRGRVPTREDLPVGTTR